MKSTGIIRCIDNLGRIVIPMEIRNAMDINTKDSLEIFVDKDMIILKKYESRCIICSCSDNLQEINQKKICDKCIENIKNSY